MNTTRLERVIKEMNKHDLDQLLVTAPNALYYLLDEMFHPGERMLALYIHKNGSYKLIINALFPKAKELEMEVIFYDDTENPVAILEKQLIQGENVGIDKEWPSHFLIKLLKRVPSLKIELGSVCVDTARMMKDQAEIERMRKASQVNDQVMAKVFELLSTKQLSEKEMQKKIYGLFEEHQTYEVSFTPSVSYGAHTAIPHHESDESKPATGQALLVDMGGRTNGYCSDMTRSFYKGTPTAKYEAVYNLVLQANLAGIAAVKPGVKLKEVDLAARKVIEEGGYGEYFTHRTGHGIGIEVHEFPDVSSINDMILEEGMTFSIEPGIYLPDEFGVRIEDIVLVTQEGCEVLNKYTKALQKI